MQAHRWEPSWSLCHECGTPVARGRLDKQICPSARSLGARVRPTAIRFFLGMLKVAGLRILQYILFYEMMDTGALLVALVAVVYLVFDVLVFS